MATYEEPSSIFLLDLDFGAAFSPPTNGEATPLPPSFALSDLLNEAGNEHSTSNDSALLQDDVHYKVLDILYQRQPEELEPSSSTSSASRRADDARPRPAADPAPPGPRPYCCGERGTTRTNASLAAAAVALTARLSAHGLDAYLVVPLGGSTQRGAAAAVHAAAGGVAAGALGAPGEQCFRRIDDPYVAVMGPRGGTGPTQPSSQKQRCGSTSSGDGWCDDGSCCEDSVLGLSGALLQQDSLGGGLCPGDLSRAGPTQAQAASHRGRCQECTGGDNDECWDAMPSPTLSAGFGLGLGWGVKVQSTKVVRGMHQSKPPLPPQQHLQPPDTPGPLLDLPSAIAVLLPEEDADGGVEASWCGMEGCDTGCGQCQGCSCWGCGYCISASLSSASHSSAAPSFTLGAMSRGRSAATSGDLAGGCGMPAVGLGRGSSVKPNANGDVEAKSHVEGRMSTQTSGKGGDSAGHDGCDGDVLIVELQLRELFRASPSTPIYDAVLAALPETWVGRRSSLLRLATRLSFAMALNFSSQGLDVPPWRRLEALAARWDARRVQLVRPRAAAQTASAPCVTRGDGVVTEQHRQDGGAFSSGVTAQRTWTCPSLVPLPTPALPLQRAGPCLRSVSADCGDIYPCLVGAQRTISALAACLPTGKAPQHAGNCGNSRHGTAPRRSLLTAALRAREAALHRLALAAGSPSAEMLIQAAGAGGVADPFTLMGGMAPQPAPKAPLQWGGPSWGHRRQAGGSALYGSEMEVVRDMALQGFGACPVVDEEEYWQQQQQQQPWAPGALQHYQPGHGQETAGQPSKLVVGFRVAGRPSWPMYVEHFQLAS